MLTRILFLSALLGMVVVPAKAGPIRLDDWKTHWFASFFSRVTFEGAPDRMAVDADGSVSITYKLLPISEQGASRASWTWSVAKSVPPTDLTRKGGDDRNLALYFAFLPKDQADQATRQSLRKLLKNPDGRVLVYVHGGAHKRGSLLPSPYLGARGKTVVLRPSGEGAATESINLAADYKRAFGGTPGALVALALSADSDDTDAEMMGVIEGLRLE
ncbi:DUF3047 domain-containing protein [Aliiroseovarius crassostreae]|uniref:DUF3047 domain-containing protein n=1 Tax=Aliiroseovarius crassostreae TaxID=154981 RepID=UPI0021FE6330|nr:DUF3047 domain-containing protein [Aliiroseovarius crassostreae]UWP89445.1 DUF3047 domain-containing protein [Aliiroseovarius crassostreae]